MYFNSDEAKNSEMTSKFKFLTLGVLKKKIAINKIFKKNFKRKNIFDYNY